MIYRDRSEAGRHIAGLLARYRESRCLVLGLPNGGIPVGIEIAAGMGAEFDLLFVSKITPKFDTEVGYGAVSESGAVSLNRERWHDIDFKGAMKILKKNGYIDE
jgi:putative phosphoribosyl transferase